MHRGKTMAAFTDPVTGPAMWGSVLLLAFLVAVGVFDFVALTSAGKLKTISEVIQGWSSQYPLVPFAAGLVFGHLFFPTRIIGTPIPAEHAPGIVAVAAGPSVNREGDRPS